MSRKRGLDSVEEPGAGVFASLRDKELFEIERNILARFVYKNQYQLRRIDILERVKELVKDLDEFLIRADPKMVDQLLEKIKFASERFFQNITMGLILPISMVCVASMARIAEILQKLNRAEPIAQTVLDNKCDDLWDEGIPVSR
jgi:hypothetical protein